MLHVCKPTVARFVRVAACYMVVIIADESGYRAKFGGLGPKVYVCGAFCSARVMGDPLSGLSKPSGTFQI